MRISTVIEMESFKSFHVIHILVKYPFFLIYEKWHCVKINTSRN